MTNFNFKYLKARIIIRAGAIWESRLQKNCNLKFVIKNLKL